MRYSLTFALGFLINVSFAQVTTTHPLSSYGIGETNTGSNAITSALGNVNSVWIDSTNVNFFNPSSYSRLSKGNTLMSLGIESRFSFYEQQGVSEFRTATLIDHFSLAFKTTKRSGLAFGLKPYASMGYEFSQSLFTGLDSIRYTYSGNGNIKNNWDLSTKRATSIVSILTENTKILKENLTAAGRGEFAPIIANSTSEGRSKNRRIEVILTPKLDEISKLLN